MDPFANLRTRIAAGRAVVGGVLSGTSADGIDVVLARFPPTGEGTRPQALAFETLPFPAALSGRVRACLDGEPLDARASALLSRDLGRAFGEAARACADAAGLALDLVGSHGQTVYHHDGEEPSGPATLQLGDGDFVAEAAGCAVASDFRQGDVAAGGEGAPLAALADGALFAGAERPLAVVNLGGMANVTLLRREGTPLSFDVGPAGSLLDGLARRLLDEPFDRDGRTAARGTPSESLVAALLAHPFLARRPPKSTGRDTFGPAWVDGVVRQAREAGVAAPADLLASAVLFVARSLVAACEAFLPERPERLVLAGGGVHNRSLLGALERSAPVPVVTSAALGVDPDAREALVFAVLAVRCVLGVPSTAAAATGAREGRILGKLSAAPARPPEDG